MVINLDMYQTLGLATFVLLAGAGLKKNVGFLEKFCIPAPVAGGLLYALLMYMLHSFGILEFNYDETNTEKGRHKSVDISDNSHYTCSFPE